MSARRPTAAISRAATVSRGKKARASRVNKGQQGQSRARASKVRTVRARTASRGRVRASRGRAASRAKVRTARAAATADAATDASAATSPALDRGGARVGDGDWGGWWNGGPVRLTPEDIRQLRGEARQFSQDAQALRGMLNGENIDPRELDEIVRALRQLEDERTYQNVEELARLQSFVAESLKRFEFGLRRKVDADKNAIALTGSDEVPEEFRKLVEQYYRSLARSPR